MWVTSWLTLGACVTWTGSALAQAPADAGTLSTQLTILASDSQVPPAPGPTLANPSLVFNQQTPGSYPAPITNCPVDPYPYPLVDFFGVGTPGVFPWSVNPPGDITAPSGAPAGGSMAQAPGGGTAQDAGAATSFTRMKAGANYKTRVQASSSVGETHAVGHHRQNEQATPAKVQAAMNAMVNSIRAAATPGAPADNFQPFFGLFSGLTFESSYAARAAVYEDTTRMGPQAAGGFLPSAIPVENQPFFGGPARTTVQGSGSSVGLQFDDSPTPDFNITTYANLVATGVDSSNTTSSGVALQQAFIKIGKLVLGSMDTAFADNDALPPTLDLFGPNARITVFNTTSSIQGQGRLSYWLHEMPTTAGFGYAINASVEQPIPEIITPATPKPFTTFARFPDLIGTFKVGEMLEAPTDAPGADPKDREYYEAWHIQTGGIVRSLGLEEANNSIDESAFGWGVSLSGHYSFFLNPCTILPDAIYGSVTYGVGIAHYIGDLHSLSLSTVGNDAVLNGTYLKSLGDLAYYAGYLHNWSDHWRSLVCYSHVTLESQGQGLPLKTFGTLYRFGDYASANIEWHRLVNGKAMGQPALYDFNMGLEYIYGRFEELSGAAGQDQRISLVAAISK
jgi:hypothetical protein